jgi:DNA-binding transcriptional LysR family regulator
MDFSMYHLRTFWDVARTRSLTKSARNLGYSQSSVTAHVRALESNVGVPLFRRMPHGVRLTGAGEVFHEYVARMFAIMDEMSSALKSSGEASGRVVVGATALLMDSTMSALVRECRYRYPRVEVLLRVLNAAQIESAVSAGDIDVGLALAPTSDAGNSPDDSVVRETLFPVRFVPVGPPVLAGVAADGARSGAGQPHERLLLVDPDCSTREMLLRRMHGVLGYAPEVMEAGSIRTALSLAGAGLGAALVPEGVIDPDGPLAIRADLPAAEVFARAAWSGDAWLSPAVSAFLALARRSQAVAG